MREVTIYYAFDDKEFYSFAKCEEYESKAFDHFFEIGCCYEFLDENKNLISAPKDSSDCEDWLKWFEYAWHISKYIQVSCLLSEESYDFIIDYFGYDMPENEIGLYKYELYPGWIKVDE